MSIEHDTGNPTPGRGAAAGSLPAERWRGWGIGSLLAPLAGSPTVRQSEVAECGLACLAMVASHNGLRIDLASLRRRFPVSTRGASLQDVMTIAGELGLVSRPLRLEMAHLRSLRLPAILHWDMDHFVVLRRVRRNGIEIQDPAIGARFCTMAEAARHFTGIALELTPSAAFVRREERVRVRLRDVLVLPRGAGLALAQTLLLSVVLQVYAVASPFYMQLAVDDAIAEADHSLLAVLACGFGLFMLINVAAGLLRSVVLVHLQATLSFALGGALLRHLLSLPLGWFERRRVGDVVSRLGATEPIRDMLAEGALGALVDGVMALLMAWLMVVYDPRLAAIVGAALCLYIALRLLTFGAVRRRALDALHAKARESGTLLETLRAIQTVKVFNRENERFALWSNSRVDTLNADAAMARLKAVFRAANNLVFGIENVLVIYVGATAALDGRMSVGMLFAFMSYKMQFIEKGARFVETALEFRMLDVQLERLSDIVEATPEPLAPLTPAAYRPPLRGRVEVRNLAFRYAPNQPPVFQDVSFAVAPGEYVAITGPSGGGKTTLMKVMLGLLPAADGEVLVDGVPLAQFGIRAFRDQVGVVMQDEQLLAGSVADTICGFEAGFDLDWMKTCAATAGIHDEVMRMPMGYNTLIGEMGGFLSGGQKQRLVLARALYRRPRILFMDEGTSHLDVALEARVNEAIRGLGLTRVIIAHRPETIASASRVLALAGGALRGGELLAGTA